MKVLVLNGSPSGRDSITLFTVRYLEKLFPLAIEQVPVMQHAQLKLRRVPGRNLMIGEIGYERKRDERQV